MTAAASLAASRMVSLLGAPYWMAMVPPLDRIGDTRRIRGEYATHKE